MSDYRNSNDPLRQDTRYDPDARSANAAWGWIAAAVFVVVVLAFAFGVGHEPGRNGTNTASNDTSPPAATRMVPPPVPTRPTSPANPAAPVTPSPNSPVPGTTQ
jgi:hypothetical protein